MRGKIKDRCRLQKEASDFVCSYGIDVPKATGFRIVTLVVTYPPGAKRHDVDAFWMATLDALKTARLIVDDSYPHVRMEPVVYRDGPAYATDIVLQDSAFREWPVPGEFLDPKIQVDYKDLPT